MERSRSLLVQRRNQSKSLLSDFITQNGQTKTTCSRPTLSLSLVPCTSLEKNTLLHFANNKEGLPEFGRLMKIWQVLDLTVAFDLDMNAVIIEESSLPQGNQISRHEDLPSYHVHHAYTLSGKLHVPLKQYILTSSYVLTTYFSQMNTRLSDGRLSLRGRVINASFKQ